MHLPEACLVHETDKSALAVVERGRVRETDSQIDRIQLRTELDGIIAWLLLFAGPYL